MGRATGDRGRLYPAATSRPDTYEPDSYREEAKATLRRFEEAGIAVFPSILRRKGSFVGGWPGMPVADGIAITRAELAKKQIGLAARTGAGWAVLDLDAQNGVAPEELLPALQQLLGAAIFAIVETHRGFHVWVRVREEVGNGFCSFIGGEVFSGPHLAMVPPSPHPKGTQYLWLVEPRATSERADLRALGLIPDGHATRKTAGVPGGERSPQTKTPAPPDVQEEFARLMALAGVHRLGSRLQMLTTCPWHDDRQPSLSVNWNAAVFYCFSAQCDARGGLAALRSRVPDDTPTYRQ